MKSTNILSSLEQHHTKIQQLVNPLENQKLCSKPTPKSVGLCLLNIFLRVTKGSEHPVHPYGIVAIVMAVRGVVNSVIACAHDGPHLAMDAVMYVCRPNSLTEQKNYVCREVDRNKEEGYHMGHGLQYPVQRMESQP